MEGVRPEELPPPLTSGVNLAATEFRRLGGGTRALVAETCEGQAVRLLLRTGTTVDVGEWFRRGRVWLACLPETLALVAAGRRCFAETAAFRDLRESRYNEITGELVLKPAESLALRRIKMPPLEGRQVLAQIYSREKNNA